MRWHQLAELSSCVQSCRVVRACETKSTQTLPNLRAAHEQFPHEAAAMVFDHDDDRALIDGEIARIDPLLALAECVAKSELAPDTVAEAFVEVSQRLHAVVWRIRE